MIRWLSSSSGNDPSPLSITSNKTLFTLDAPSFSANSTLILHLFTGQLHICISLSWTVRLFPLLQYLESMDVYSSASFSYSHPSSVSSSSSFRERSEKRGGREEWRKGRHSLILHSTSLSPCNHICISSGDGRNFPLSFSTFLLLSFLFYSSLSSQLQSTNPFSQV